MAIGIILGIVIAIIAIGCLIYAVNDENVICGIIAAVAIIAFILVPFSFHTVDTGEVAVVKRLGKVVDVRSAGTYYDFWMTKSYTKYDTKVRNVDITTAAYSSDAQSMDIQMTLQYQIMSDNITDIVTQYGSLKTLENRIQSVSIEKTKSVLSSYKAMDIIANRAAISPAVESAIKNAIGEDYFVNVVTVVLTNIDFSDAFELAVEEKMIAEQTKLKAEYDNQTKIAQAEAAAEAKLKEAQAEIDIAQAQADAKLKQAQAQIEITKAEAEAKKIAAEAEAKANEIISASLTEDIIKKILADAWNGEVPKVVGSGDYMLPTDILQ